LEVFNIGYEVIYTYHERQDGVYNKDETKTLKRKVGDPFDDISLEKLASVVMGQLARRDIFVVGVEVFELSKKKISFRETDNGVVIKNKKFLFDQATGEFVVRDAEPEFSQHPQLEVPQIPSGLHPHEIIVKRKELTASGEAPVKRVIDQVIFVPEPQHIPEVSKRGFKLTIDKKYPVYTKQSGIHGDAITILDDSNNEIKISDKYFVPGNTQLFADNELKFSESQKQRDNGNLNWGNAINENMPNLRK